MKVFFWLEKITNYISLWDAISIIAVPIGDKFAGFWSSSGAGMKKKDGIIFCHDIIADVSEAVSENIENLDVTLTSPSTTRCQAENVTFFRSYCRQSMNYSVTGLQLTDLH